jgi:hypothetical protein
MHAYFDLKKAEIWQSLSFSTLMDISGSNKENYFCILCFINFFSQGKAGEYVKGQLK